MSVTPDDPYRGDERKYFLIAYTLTTNIRIAGGAPMVHYHNVVIDGSPVDWLRQEVEDVLLGRPAKQPVPFTWMTAPPPVPPVLVGAWPITKEQFERLRPLMWGGEVKPC